ncbi:MAG: hypothetical protein AABX47_03595 [Nanoarchaeota archaeon]
MTNEEKGPENVAAQTYVLLDPRDFDLGDPRILPLIPKEVYRKAILNRIKPLGEVSGIQIEDLDVRGKLQGYGQVAHISLTPIGSIGSLCDPDRRSRNRDLEEKIKRGLMDLKGQPGLDYARFPAPQIIQLIAGFELVETAMYLVRLKLKKQQCPVLEGYSIERLRDIEPKRIEGDKRIFRLNYSYVLACAPGEEGIECQKGRIIAPHAKWPEWARNDVHPGGGSYLPSFDRIDGAEIIEIGRASLPRYMLQDYPMINEYSRVRNQIVYNDILALVLFDKIFPTHMLTKRWLRAKKTQHFSAGVSARFEKGEFREALGKLI